MNADATQPPLSPLWFFACCLASGLLIAGTLLADRVRERRRKARAAYRAHCDQVLRGGR
ncbi:MAG TPA: hypothetical protein VHC18_18300 [Amycolatopsis sp.]|nr:hypothetical protein [Amycolatopsis sp.]